MLKRLILASVLAAAGAMAPLAAQDADAEARRRENEQKLARAAAEEDKRIAALKAFEQEQAEREKQLAREKQALEAKRANPPDTTPCHYKAVMSDEDIARCRAVYRN
jgi:hypothetical protein